MMPLTKGRVRQGDDASFVVVRVRFTVARMIREIFVTSLLTYLVFTIIDNLISGFVSRQFNMGILLWVMLLSGVISIILLEREPVQADAQMTKRSPWSIVSIFVVGFIAAVLVWLKTTKLGWMSLPIALLSGVTLVLLSLLLLKDNEPKGDNS